MDRRSARRAPRLVAAGMTATALAVGNLVLTAQPAAAAVTASFTAGGLSVIADSLDNVITVSRNPAGQILVNGGAVAVAGGSPTVANVTLIRVFGLGGNDVLTLSETNGALPRADLFGGSGNDALTGGSSNDQLFGEAGNDTLAGRGGVDFLFGGTENDTLTGGDADDQVFGQAGNDRMVWNPGDDTDLNEGAAGTDTAEVNGGNGAEQFTVSANGIRVRLDRVAPAPFSIDVGTTENVVINANGGDDVVHGGGGLAALTRLTVDGGAGNDDLRGSDGIDILLGGDGRDAVDGGDGDDVAFLGAGDDEFAWNPGDDDDVVEGQDGIDRLQFTGGNAGESVDLSANGGRVRLFRDVANVLMDLSDLERVTFQALGGADRITVGDLSGTDLTDVVTDLAGASGQPDGAADDVRVRGTSGDDVVQVEGSGAQQAVIGLAARVSVVGAELGADDRLLLDTLSGDDVVEGSTLSAPAALVADGGAGNDVLIGGGGDDVLSGGAGDDVLIGGLGQDVLDGGAGDNVLLGGETIINGRVVSRKWLAQNARTVDGSTEIDLGRKRLIVRGIPLDALQRTVG
jgi:Ca2+-binding RTX toxin-like protein